MSPVSRNCTGPGEYSLLADIAEIAVPEDGKPVDEKHTVVDWDKGEVDHLDEWPNHPVASQCAPVGPGKFLAWADALKDGHRTQEDEKVGWREHKLVHGYTCTNLELLILKSDLGLKELEPCRRSWSKNRYGFSQNAPKKYRGSQLTSSVKDHAASAWEVMLCDALLLDSLLRHDISSSEKQGGSDTLGQHWARCQLQLIPGHFFQLCHARPQTELTTRA